MPPFYIGHTYIKRIQKGYHGSVQSKLYQSIWKAELKENPHLFKTTILSYHNSKEEANNKEKKFQLAFQVHKNSMYINQCITQTNFYSIPYGNKNMLGKKHSEETKQKIREARAKQKINHSTETKEKIRKSLTGKKHSEETISKLTENARTVKRIFTLEGRMKISLTHKNKKYSQEHKDKISKSRKGMKFSEEHKENLRKARLYGKGNY